MNNELLNYYQNYLVNDKKTGKATVKNYIADVRKFIAWYETQFSIPFIPKSVTKEIANAYVTGQQAPGTSSVMVAATPSASSLKRYASSMRKFYQFLSLHKFAENNPFEISPIQAALASDPWHLKEFRNYLFLSSISKITLKNYMIDTKQFAEWADSVQNKLTVPGKTLVGAEKPSEASVLQKVDTRMVEEYKRRLLTEANLSPVSINRKLSSLRKYIAWANKQGFMNQEVTIASEVLETQIPAFIPEPVVPAPLPLTLEDMKAIEPANDESLQNVPSYSRFPPLRLLQKTSKLFSLGASSMILLPIDKTAEFVRYTIWKKSGRKVFAPIEEVVGATTSIAGAQIIQPVAVQAQAISIASTQTIQAAKFLTFLSRKIGLPNARQRIKIKGFPKSFYAPLAVSTQNLPLSKKVLHHLRHTRPAWYHRYHTYQIVHYIHFGILLAVGSVLGMHVYATLSNQARNELAAIASPPTSPPRVLSFQGKLNDATNTPITAETNLRFAIYKSPTGSGSAKLWEERQMVDPDYNGSFSVLLGKKQSLRQDIFSDNPSLFLGISVGGEQELKPRQPLANVTNASNANSLQGLKPITDLNAGTRNVVLALDSSGNLTMGGSANPVFQATGGEFTLSGQVLTLTTNPGSNSNVQIKPDGSGIVDIQKPIQNTSEYNKIPSAAGAVEIDDMLAILATSSGQSALTINQNGTGPIISASASGTAKFTVDSAGDTFVGGNLSLNGNKLSSSANSFDLINTSAININFGGTATAISIGANSGTTTINNGLKVKGIGTFDAAVNVTGLLTANGGFIVPEGRALKLAGFVPGSIPFIGAESQLASDAANLFWDNTNKRLGIGTSTPGSKLTVANLGTGTGTALVMDADGNVFKNSSSRRYKEDIKPLPNNALALLNTAPVSFRYKDTGTYDIGYIAEDFDSLGLKDLVIYDKDGKPDAIKYDKMSIYILELVKQQQSAIKALQEITGTIKAGYIEVSQITTQSLSIVTEDIMIGGTTVRNYIAAVVSDSLNQQPAQPTTQPVIDSPVATSSAIVTTEADSVATESGMLTSTHASSSALLSIDNSIYNNVSTISAAASASAEPIIISPTPSTQINGSYPAGNNATTFQTTAAGGQIAPQTNYANISSLSGQLSYVPQLQADFATFNQGVIALGPSSLTDVGVSGKLSVGGNLDIDANSINTIGSDLNLQPLRQGNLAIMGGLVTIDTEGNLAVGGNATFAKDVEVKGKLAAGIIAPVPGSDVIVKLENQEARSTNQGTNTNSSFVIKDSNGKAVTAINQAGDIIASGAGTFQTIAGKNFKIIRGVQADTSLTETVADGSAGTGAITAYEVERTIRTPYVTKDSLVYVTATSNTQKVTPYVARQTDNSFTVQIPSSVAKDITFNWWIVN